MSGTERLSPQEFRERMASGQFQVGKKGKIIESNSKVFGKDTSLVHQKAKAAVSPAPKVSTPKAGDRAVEGPKTGKYRNEKVTDPDGGKKFDSKLEARHGAEYSMMLKAGKILKVTRQVRFLVERYEFSKKEIHYVADFLIDHLDGSQEVVDSKGVETKEFKRKAKWFKARYPHIKFTVRSK